MTDGVGLDDIYGATIERIKAQGGDKSRLGMGALMWICHAEEQLIPDELGYALAIELGSTDFNASNIPSIVTLMSCCQGLITMDKGKSTVRLIHFTLREYLCAHPDIFDRPHSAIAEICLTYLNCQQVRALSAGTSDYLNLLIHDNPFLLYCSLYWGVHAKKDLSDCARSLALQLLREYDGHISTALSAAIKWAYPQDPYTGSLWSGLHCASHFGIVEVVISLIQMGCYDLNEVNYWGYTALALAAEMGHVEVVEILLGREDISPDRPGDEARTPLSHAALNGHERVVEMLLRQKEVNPDKPDNFGRTPLSYAASTGKEEVVKILLGREEVNPDRPNILGKTPLSYASEGGNKEVVKILLRREEVNPDRPDNRGKTPLSYAAEGGKEEIVKILLRREDVSLEKEDFEGRTPLRIAARWGEWGVVALLQSHKAVIYGGT